MAREDPDSTIAKAHAVFIRLALPPYSVHFKSPTYLHPTTLDLLDKKVSKETLKATSSTTDTSAGSAVREAIGTDSRFWEEWVEVLRAAVPSLEKRSFDILDDGNSVDYESARGALIASNYPGLWKDLERLNDVVSIGRNVLTVGKPAQDLAAEYGVESEMFRLIHVCVRVTARGYDSEAGTQEEEKWQWVVNAYKKVLITSLQFLNNLVAQNEERKLRLWVSLFDTPAPTEQQDGEQKQVAQRPPPPPPEPALPPEPPCNTNDILLAYGTTGPSQRLSPLEMQAAQPMYANEGFKDIPWPAMADARTKAYKPNAWVYFVSQYKKKCIEDFQKVHKRSPMLGEIHKNLPRYWHELEEAETVQQRKPHKQGFRYTWILWDLKYKDALRKYKEDLEKWEKRDESPPAAKPVIEPLKPPPAAKPPPPPLSFTELEDELTERMEESGPTTAPPRYNFAARQDLEFNPLKPRSEDEETDLKMLFTAEAGKKILEVGKVELMRRLEGEGGSNGRRHSTSGQGLSPPAGSEVADGSMAEMMYDEIQKGRAEEAKRTGRRRTSEPSLLHPHNPKNADDDLEEEEVDDSDESGSDSGSDESYPGSSEDGRGLLTDVPLILGPSEIEVLPMLIMSGIVETVPGPNKPWLTEWEFHGAPPFVPWEEQHEGQLKMRHWHTLRTNLLLSNTSGRNLLRELLIFVAAWDLREEELYFKFMLKITESILKNGLMPYAYHAFRDRSKSKDIISPAQAVLIKLLTSIFRTRTSTFLHALREGSINNPDRLCAHHEYGPMPFTLYLARMKYVATRADLQLMTFLFSEFRQHIIPQTCALIFLQGQVRRGRAGNEDFPLNLWDMERMYEGVYQVLEFFAGIVEEIPANSAPAPPAEGLYGGPAHPLSGYWLRKQFEALRAEAYRGEERWPTAEAKQMEKECRMGEWFSWKKVLAGWEMVSELVTLLRELEDGIPKINAQQGVPQQANKAIAPPPGQLASTQQRDLSADAAVGVDQADDANDGPPPFAVERPFDLDPPNSDSTLPPLPQQYQQQDNDLFEPEHPLAYPEDQTGPVYNAPLSTHDQDEPADFEWRNLKKLTVLVLSSLVWKNKQVQDQLREYGGLEVLLRCCREDENNPYIREHAIMCLRFAVEGNQANRDAIKQIAETKGLTLVDKKSSGGTSSKVEEVPSEVLDEHVYETHMDGGGRVGLRRKDQVHPTLFHPGQTSTAVSLPSSATAAGATTTAGAKNKGPNGWIGNYGAAPATDASITNSAQPAAEQNPEGRVKTSQTEMTAEEAAELMQKALRNLPLVDKGASDLQKAEALAKLDRAFEGAEKALGQGVKGKEGEGGK